MDNLTEDLTLKELQVGDIINKTATVVALTKLIERVVGDCFATWVALCVRSDENFHPYAVWKVSARPEGFSAGNGNYARTLKEATEYYNDRGGK